MSDYKVKYQLFFHTFNKTVEGKLEIANGTNFFDGETSVMVMTENIDLRNNRINLLSILRNQSLIIADFSKLS